MKKLMIIALALIFMAPALVSAGEKVSVSGTYYLWAYDTENYADFDDTLFEDEVSWFKSKLRMGLTFKPADDITLYCRLDIAEEFWGTGENGAWNRPVGPHYDYVWANITKEYGSLTVGHQPFILGNAINAFVGPGLVLAITPPNTPISTALIYSKNDEGNKGDLNDGINGHNDDIDLYAVNFNYKADTFGLDVFAALADAKTLSTEIKLLGAAGTTKIGIVDVAAEINIFNGEIPDEYGVGEYSDIKGLQLFAQASFNPTEQCMIAFQGLYAKGYDDAVQYHNIGFDNDQGLFSPFDYGMQQGEELFAKDHTGFELLGENAGIIGLNIVADYKMNDFTLIQGSIGYAKPEESSVTTIDDAIIFNIGVTFDIATGTQFGVQYNRIAADGSLYELDDAQALMAGLYINF